MLKKGSKKLKCDSEKLIEPGFLEVNCSKNSIRGKQ